MMNFHGYTADACWTSIVILEMHQEHQWLHWGYMRNIYGYIGDRWGTSMVILEMHEEHLWLYWRCTSIYGYIRNAWATSMVILEMHREHLWLGWGASETSVVTLGEIYEGHLWLLSRHMVNTHIYILNAPGTSVTSNICGNIAEKWRYLRIINHCIGDAK